MVRWIDLAFPKEFGGIGLTETRMLNIALLAKWIIKLESHDNSLCIELLRKKYLQQGGIFQFVGEKGSQIWKGVLNVRKWMSLGSVWSLGNGSHIWFWQDVWLGTCPLKTRFHNIYEICNQQYITVSEVCTRGFDCLTFRRSFGNIEEEQWNELKEMIAEVLLSENPDTLTWGLSTNKKYTTKSLYEMIAFRGVRDVTMLKIWKCPAPMKMKHFVWLARKNRIQSAEQLKMKNWSGSEYCQLYGEIESTSHILFTCPMASFVWCVCRDSFGWHLAPRNFEDLFLLNEMNNKAKDRVFSALLVAVSWVLWTTRNNMIFRNKIVYSLLILPFQIVSFLLQWKALCRSEEGALMDHIAVKLKGMISSLGAQRTGLG